MSHNFSFEKLSRALKLHEQGLSSAVIGERLGISAQAAARTIIQAKERKERQRGMEDENNGRIGRAFDQALANSAQPDSDAISDPR